MTYFLAIIFGIILGLTYSAAVPASTCFFVGPPTEGRGVTIEEQAR